MTFQIRQVARRQALQGLVGLAASGASAVFDGVEAQPANPSAQPKREMPGRDEGKKNTAWLTLPVTPELPTAKRQDRTTLNGASLFYAQFGEGPSHVLLLHGGMANSHYWGHQVKELATRFVVTVMDTRGHGRSPVISNDFRYRIFAEDAIALLDFLKIDAAAVVGWSDGGITGLQLAMTKPNRVSRLFAFGANSSLDAFKAGGSRSGVFGAFAERCRVEYGRLSPNPERWQQLLNGLRIMWRREPNFGKAQLASLKLPVTICDGEHDEIIKLDHARGIARTIPNARLVILPGVSHFAMLQNPSQFNKALLEFMISPS